MLRLKYKAHRFVNLIFYFIVFVLGFMLGGGRIEEIFNSFNILI